MNHICFLIAELWFILLLAMDTMLTDGVSRQKTGFPRQKNQPNGVYPDFWLIYNQQWSTQRKIISEGFSLCCLMTPGFSKDIQCYV